MDERYDTNWIFNKASHAFPKKPTISIEIKGTENEYFTIFGPGSLLRGKLDSASMGNPKKSDFFENRDSLGKVIVKYGGNEKLFQDYNTFLNYIDGGS